MKIVIPVLLIILVLLGFGFYNFISDEVVEFNESQVSTYSDVDIQVITVDNPDDFTKYTQRVSTYEQSSESLLNASSRLYDTLDMDYLHLFYYSENQLIHQEYLGSDIPKLEFYGECLLVVNEQIIITTELEKSAFKHYQLPDQYVIHIKPDQTGQFTLSFDEYKLEFENLKREP